MKNAEAGFTKKKLNNLMLRVLVVLEVKLSGVIH
jgi:hypothetical protein